jgi:hypothetical protein
MIPLRAFLEKQGVAPLAAKAVLGQEEVVRLER